MEQSRDQQTILLQYAILAGIGWSLLMMGSLIWNISAARQQIRSLATTAARSHFEKDQSLRYWATEHGGVYVPTNERTPPNPHLEHVPGRDILASGAALTLMNPAYMLRQVMEEHAARYGVKGHITSLRLLRPENAPDDWERQALSRFEEGAEEVVEFTEMEGAGYLRLMRPMVIETGCLKCHGHQGYMEGDIRGGVSMTVPMSPYEALAGPVVNGLLMWHGGVWLLGLGALGLVLKRSRHLVSRRLQAEEALKESNASLAAQVKQRTVDLQETNHRLRAEVREREHAEKDASSANLELETILDATPSLIFYKDSHNQMVRVNKSLAEARGLSREQIEGESAFDLFPAQAESYWQDDQEVMASGHSKLGIVETMEGPNGETLWVRTDKIPFRDEQGEVIGVIGFATDITERRQAEEELHRQKEWLQVTLASIGDAVIATDTAETVLFLNPVSEALTGWTAEEALGRNVNEVFRIVNEETRDPAANSIKRVLEEGDVVGLANHTALIARDGREISIADSAAPIAGADGVVQGVVLVFRDMTDSQRMEAERLRANNLESLGILAGGIAHDFNNVLTGVVGNLALLERMLDKDSTEYEIASDAQQAADKTRGLTQQLLTFAKGGAPVTEIATIEKLIQESAGLSLHGAKTRPEYHFPSKLSSVEVDTGQIGQVIQNLVLNADQAMPNGGTLNISAAEVEVTDADPFPLDSGCYIEVSVEDEGIGMPESILDRVFDPYFSTKEAGHGLGLSICRSIIQRHHGHITATSQQGVGTTFTFYLPASQAQPVPTETAEEKRDEPMGSGRILLMDDEEVIQRTVGRALGVFGYHVTCVSGGGEALQAYQAALHEGHPYDLVIMDLTIPGDMGGREAIAKLLEIDPQVRALVSSGYSTDPVMANPKDYGFAGAVSKPVSMEQLAKTVKRALAGPQ